MGLGPVGWISLSRSVQERLEEPLARWPQFQPLQSHGPGFKLRSSVLPSYVEIHSFSVSLHLSICEGQGRALASWGLSYGLRKHLKSSHRVPTWLSWTTYIVVVAQSLSRVWLCNPWTSARRASLSFTISQSLLRFMSLESVMLSNHLTLCHPLLLLASIFPSIKVFPMSCLFESGGQSITASSVLPMTIQDWFPLGLTGLISLQSKGLSRVFSNATVQNHQFFGTQLPL